MPDSIDARLVLSRDGEDRTPISMDRQTYGFFISRDYTFIISGSGMTFSDVAALETGHFVNLLT